jgi:Cys-tRNA(Pro)/Cys-tRNA(Cys) deacylase
VNDATPLTRVLEAMGIPHRLVRHPAPLRSVEQAAAERNQTPAQVVRSILFHLGGGRYALVLIAGTRQASWQALRRHFGQSRLTMASQAEVRDVTGYEVGTVGPFGLRREVRILVDESVLEQEEISFGAGEVASGVIMRGKDFIKALGNVEIGDFTAREEKGKQLDKSNANGRIT